jgi:hypothetical protein
MASILVKKPCVKCQKGGGVTTCDGCQQSFCIKHIIVHRQELATQMDGIGQEHDSLRRDLIQEDITHPLLLRIDGWEQESISKIQIAAKIARADLQRLLDQIKDDAKISADQISNELQTHRESDDYTEIDLMQWSARLIEVRKLLKAPSAIKIAEDKNISSVIHLITVHEQKQLYLPSKCTRTSEQSLLPIQKLIKATSEKFGKAMDAISLSEDGVLATYVDNGSSGYMTVFGRNLYRSGIHHISFRIENQGRDNFFFGIATSSQGIEPRIFDKSTVNGWWTSGNPVVNGRRHENCGKNILQTGDIAKLTLDCDNSRIQFENYQTKTIVQSCINIAKCPFPWKIAISFSRPDDILRITS